MQFRGATDMLNIADLVFTCKIFITKNTIYAALHVLINQNLEIIYTASQIVIIFVKLTLLFIYYYL